MNYEDLYDLPHPVSRFHPQMSMHDRAAQFSPFAALTGYEEAVREEERMTEERVQLEEADLDLLDRTLAELSERLDRGESTEAEVRYFVPDERKEGGRYETLKGTVRRVDTVCGKLIFADRREVELGSVVTMRIGC